MVVLRGLRGPSLGGATHATTLPGRDGLIRPRSLLRAHRDERLVAQLRAGNEHAFEVLFDRYRPRLLAFCRGMLRSSEDAEDVLQEVFTAAHSAILADEREIEVRAWLYRIARNRCLNHMRRPRPECRDTLDDQPGANGASTEEHAQARADLRDLVSNIRDLPEAQRSALLMRELEAFSYSQIAASLETTVPAVKSLLVRARITLAEASQASELTCDEVRFELAAAAEGMGKASGPARHPTPALPRVHALPQAPSLDVARARGAGAGRPGAAGEEVLCGQAGLRRWFRRRRRDRRRRLDRRSGGCGCGRHRGRGGCRGRCRRSRRRGPGGLQGRGGSSGRSRPRSGRRADRAGPRASRARRDRGRGIAPGGRRWGRPHPCRRGPQTVALRRCLCL